MQKKNVLITGASRGIGRACALLFAEKGWHVFLNCDSSLGELQAVAGKIERLRADSEASSASFSPSLGKNAPHGSEGASALCGSCTLLPGDVGDPEDVRRIFGQIRDICGGLDVLVNNAGAAHFGLLTDMSDQEWDRILRVNLSSVFYCCREAVPYMVRQKRGKIINISSMWGVSGASCEAAYSAAKAGVHGLTKALAKELAPSNIQVNAVACGAIDTAMNARLTPEEKQAFAEDIPSGRFGSPEEVARLVCALADAPEYLTAQIISLDGGYL